MEARALTHSAARFACLIALIGATAPARAADTVLTFDDLAAAYGTPRAGGNAMAVLVPSLTYDGVVFPNVDSGGLVVGDLYYENNNTHAPITVPHSGHYAYLSPRFAADSILATDMSLESVYLGSIDVATGIDGATAMTIRARHGTSVLGEISVTGLAKDMTFVDTSPFGSLVGIDNYDFHIDTYKFYSLFAADDFVFGPAAAATVPEPGALPAATALGVSCLGVLLARRRRRG